MFIVYYADSAQEFCQVSPGPFPRSARGPGYEATLVPGPASFRLSYPPSYPPPTSPRNP